MISHTERMNFLFPNFFEKWQLIMPVNAQAAAFGSHLNTC